MGKLGWTAVALALVGCSLSENAWQPGGTNPSLHSRVPQTLIIRPADFSDEGGGHVQKDAARPGAHNTILWMWNDPGHWLEWTIPDVVPGRYHVVIRYSSDQIAARKLMLNEKPAPGLERFDMPSTGGWNTWRELELTPAVGLEDGVNILRLESLGGKGVNLDEIKLVPVPPPATPPPATPSNPLPKPREVQGP